MVFVEFSKADHPVEKIAVPVEHIIRVETSPNSCVHARIHLIGGESIDVWEDYDDVMATLRD